MDSRIETETLQPDELRTAIEAYYSDAFPRDFAFYHLGDVRAAQGVAAPESVDWVGSEAIAFAMSGDIRGLAVVLFPRGAAAPGGDFSSWFELANVLASRLATRLSAQRGLEVILSPPRYLKGAELRTLPDPRSSGVVIKSYLHQRPDGVVGVQLALFTAPAEGASHA
jgi:hypothetical protein